jgi:SAM-dependent methyltransferase
MRTLILLALAAALAEAPFPPPGRPIAPVVSPTWGLAAQRDAAGEVDQIIDRLGLKPGATVADIGAGDGYDTIRLARRLGPHALVLAEDLDPAALQRLARAAAAAGLANVRVQQGRPDDPGFPAHTVDAVIMVHMYHEIANPFALLSALAKAFRTGGRLGILELDRPTQAHGTPPGLLRCELAAVGYRARGFSPLPGGLGYFAVFDPPKDDRPTPPELIRPCAPGRSP